MKQIQLVNWFPIWKGLKFKLTNPMTDKNAGYYLVYSWFVVLGFWEIRKFMNKQQREIALKLYRQLRKQQNQENENKTNENG